MYLNDKQMILVGGQALRQLGHDRHTEDTDYLVCDKSTKAPFLHKQDNVDLLNANGNKFFATIYKLEKGNAIASPQSLFDLKAYAYVQHCQLGNWSKADACEYDLKFLARTFGVQCKSVIGHITDGQASEINKLTQKR